MDFKFSRSQSILILTLILIIHDNLIGGLSTRKWQTNTYSNSNYRGVGLVQRQTNYKNSYSYQYQYKYANQYSQPGRVQNNQQFNYVRNQDYIFAGLRWINRYRNTHRVQSLSLDQDLVQRAQNCALYYAKRGVIDHSCGQKNGAGENLFMYRSIYSYSGMTDAAIQAISSWYREQRFYKNLYNRDPNGFSTAWGHFTQLVWRSSQRFGIGIATVGSRTCVTALFYPPGNHLRQFQENVLPPY